MPADIYVVKMTNLKLKIWNEEEFLANEEAWTSLLNKSNSNKLFMSWIWQSSWWKSFSTTLEASLYIIAIYSSRRLVALAPFYSHKVTASKILRINRLELIGNEFHGNSTVRSEYMGFITQEKYRISATEIILKHISDTKKFDEIILMDLLKEQADPIQKSGHFSSTQIKVANTYQAYKIHLNDNFSSYLNLLGKNSRLKLFNRRKRIKKSHSIEIQYSTYQQLDDYFYHLNKLHSIRWNKPVFSNERLSFHKIIAKHYSKSDKLIFSKLLIDQTPQSVQYNLVEGDTVYNIQLGFNDKFNPKVPLGYLHYGYEIEHAYDSGLKYFDFLAGKGKNTQFKEKISNSRKEFITLRITNKIHITILSILKQQINKIKINYEK